MQLPFSLRRAVERELTEQSSVRVAKAAAELSSRYRAPDAVGAFISTAAHRAGYLSTRLPATYAAARAALSEVRRRLPSVEVTDLLDLGAGPGTALWAAANVFPGLTRATLIERDRELIEIGRRLVSDAEHEAVALAEWRALDLRAVDEFEPHDLVVASYAFGELDAEARAKVIGAAWRAARRALIIIEPGTRRGFGHVREARSQLIALGAEIVAPCPPLAQCPMGAGDWCHFAVRVERTTLHRRAKTGTLGYEDEKYSYVAASKSPAETKAARIIRRPQHRAGHLHLDLCTESGLRRVTLSKKDKEAYKRARKAAWGDRWED